MGKDDDQALETIAANEQEGKKHDFLLMRLEFRLGIIDVNGLN